MCLLAVLARRNNLTIIDVVTMQGQGGYGELRFSNRKPGSQKPLVFEMSDKQLRQCDSKFCGLLSVKQCGSDVIVKEQQRWVGFSCPFQGP